MASGPLAMLLPVAGRPVRQALVRDGAALMRPGRLQQAVDTASERLLRCRLGVGRVMLRLDQPVAGRCREPAFPGPLQVVKARADRGEPVSDLIAARLGALGMALHEMSMPGADGCVTAVTGLTAPWSR